MFIHLDTSDFRSHDQQVPLSSSGKPQPMLPSPYFSTMRQMYEDRSDSVYTGEAPQRDCQAQADMQETGSDASTTDTSPYIADDIFQSDVMRCELSDMTWHGSYPPFAANLPYPNFTAPAYIEHQQQPWPERGWADLQGIPSMIPAATVGSSKHSLGQCKPCAFAWKPEGCNDGSQCKFCHFCPPGEKQRRKKVLRQLQRGAGLRR